jgi:uncharacterized membrane protein YhaH (DUF805 family)
MLLIKNLNLRQYLISGIVALLFVSPWLLWVFTVTGTFIPTSGDAQASLINSTSALVRIARMSYVLVDHLTLWIYSKGKVVVIIFELATLIGLVGLLFFKNISIKLSLNLTKVYYAWGLSLITLVPVYIIFFRVAHFYDRYTAPLLCIIIPFLGSLLALIFSKFNRAKDIFQNAFILFMLISFFVFSYFSLHTGRIGNSHSVSAGFINSEISDDIVVGAFQSGVIGYFNSNVINLDGKVNYSALMAIKHGTMEQYIDDAQISVVVDWPTVIRSS